MNPYEKKCFDQLIIALKGIKKEKKKICIDKNESIEIQIMQMEKSTTSCRQCKNKWDHYDISGYIWADYLDTTDKPNGYWFSGSLGLWRQLCFCQIPIEHTFEVSFKLHIFDTKYCVCHRILDDIDLIDIYDKYIN